MFAKTQIRIKTLRQKRNSNKSHITQYTEVFIILRDFTGYSNVFLVTAGFCDEKG